MKLREYPELDEKLYTETLPSGLKVIVCPKAGFTRKCAYLCVDFGSIHTHYTLGFERKVSPAGTAHYMEHRIFESPERDYAASFAALGANVNAFTSYDVTAYYFSCTEHFDESLRLLLQMVANPIFTEQGVEKERGVIAQEIAMNEDDPNTRVFENLTRAMYALHPIREPILGTPDSLKSITAEDLQNAHRAFYRADNMALCVVGDVQPDAVAAIAAQEIPAPQSPPEPIQRGWNEPPQCVQRIVRDEMDIVMPTFQLAFKCACAERGEAQARQEVIGDLAAEMLFGESSRLYRALYERGVIDTSFGGGFEAVDGCAMLTCSGDSSFPEAVRDALLTEAARIAREGLDDAEFARTKRSTIGRRIRSLDGLDGTCYRLCAYALTGFDYFRLPNLYRQCTPEDVVSFLAQTVRGETCAMSVLYPNHQEVAK